MNFFFSPGYHALARHFSDVRPLAWGICASLPRVQTLTTTITCTTGKPVRLAAQ